MNNPNIIDELEPCPKTPNRVSSTDTSRGDFVSPQKFAGSARDAQHRLRKILNQFEGARMVTFEDNVVEVEFVSSILRFVDDVEFYLDEHNKTIHVRSASRVKYSDLGVNRRRIEKIRKLFDQNDDLFS